MSATRSPGASARSTPRRTARPPERSNHTPRKASAGGGPARAAAQQAAARGRAVRATAAARGRASRSAGLAARPPRARRAAVGGRGVLGEQAVGAQRRARLLDAARRRAQAGAREEPRARRRERGRALGRPFEEAARRGVAGERARLEREHAVGGAEAALEAVLDEHDRRPPLLVEAPQQPDELVAGDRVELRGRLVEQHEPRPAGERRAERDALQLAAGQLVRRAVEQVADAERERRLLDPARDRRPRRGRGSRAAARARRAPSTARPASRGPETACPPTAEIAAGPCARVSRPPVTTRPRELAAVEVRHEPAGGAQERRLARRRQPGGDDELARARCRPTRRAAPARAACG